MKKRKPRKSLQVACRQCDRSFRNNRGVISHLRFCNPASMGNEVGRPLPLAALNEVDNNFNGADDAVAEQQFFLETHLEIKQLKS